MPSKNAIKIYIEDGIYHIYNQGVEKRDIFMDKQDYRVFLYYLKSYLISPEKQENPPRNITYSQYSQVGPGNKSNLRGFDLYKKIKLFAYCLMPNHFHFMVKQHTENAITEFMRRLSNAYVKYFNEKYDRKGSLFQGRYKAILIDNEAYFLHLSRYIHRNPLDLFQVRPESGRTWKREKLREYPYSSYADYLGKRNTSWVYKDEIMEYFNSNKDTSNFSDYQDFVENYDEDSKEILGDLALD